jgi:hypothetical protein
MLLQHRQTQDKVARIFAKPMNYIEVSTPSSASNLQDFEHHKNHHRRSHIASLTHLHWSNFLHVLKVSYRKFAESHSDARKDEPFPPNKYQTPFAATALGQLGSHQRLRWWIPLPVHHQNLEHFGTHRYPHDQLVVKLIEKLPTSSFV